MLDKDSKKLNKKLVPLRRFTEEGPYSTAYLSLLVQRKKLKAKKVGRNYFTSREWFNEYLETHARDHKRKESKMDEWVCFALLINKQNKIVLVQDKDKPKPNLWKMPGGKKQRWEEYYSQTITRELNEELPYSQARIATAKPLKKLSKGKPIPHMFIVFEGTYNFPIKPGGELKKAKEFTKDEVMGLIRSEKLLTGHSEILREILNEKI